MISQKTRLTYLLFLVILIEGYVVLAAELLAIRQTIPFVGSGTDTVSIIIAAVLMPLACGYYVGGRYKSNIKTYGGSLSIRQKLTKNIVIASLFLAFGLSFISVDLFFLTLLQSGIDNRILLTTLYALVLIVTPVFLLGQTVPLVSNYFSSRKLSQITGKMLFTSTVGSFFGSVISTIILMRYVGVNNTVNVLFFLLTFLVFLLSKNKLSERPLLMVGIVVSMLILNSTAMLGQANIVATNAYNTVTVKQDSTGRYLGINGSNSSKIGVNGEKYLYVEYIERHFLIPLMNDNIPPKNILVVGAAGFTFGLEDNHNQYTYVDIDPDIKKIAEEHFLPKKLGPNKKFKGEDIRAYMATNQLKYDLILLDAYSSVNSIPETLVTQNFFKKMKDSLADNGVLVTNFITSPNFNDSFSRRLDNTFRSVFPQYNRHVLSPEYNAFLLDKTVEANVIYSYFKVADVDNTTIYTDNLNTTSFDRLNDN